MKRNLVFIGFLFVAVNVFMPIVLDEESGFTVTIDVLPDFLGFVLIYLGLEKLNYKNGLIRECGVFSIGFAVFSALTFLGQVSNLLLLAVKNSYFVGALRLFGSIYSNLEYLILGVFMLFTAFFCLGAAKETDYRRSFAENDKRFSWKDEYSETHFSRRAHTLYKAFSYIFFLLYGAGGVAYFVCHFLETKLVIFGVQTGIWAIFLPLHLLFMFYLDNQLKLIDGSRPGETVLPEKTEEEA